jgi:tetratricopeptide (TPR) repeat protein
MPRLHMCSSRIAISLSIVITCSLLLSQPRRVLAWEPHYDAMQELLDQEARDAMGKGEYQRALHFFWRLLKIDPADGAALREAGRCAKALGYSQYAEKALERANQLHGDMFDPELHFLRGEALLSLGRKQEAWAELAKAEEQLNSVPLDRNGKLWRARIFALRGDLPASDKAYWDLLPPDSSSKEYAGVMADMAEAHILANDWKGAEWVVRRLLKVQPEDMRGREMLAWVLERRGNTDEELQVRAHLATEEDIRDDASGRAIRYGQALERAHDYEGALHHYRQAEDLGSKDVGGDIERIELVVAPETAAGVGMADDPSGSVRGFMVGATLPFTTHFRLAVTGTRQTITDSNVFMPVRQDFTLSTVTPRLIFDRRGDTIAAGGTVYWTDTDSQPEVGGNLTLRSRPGRPVQLQLTGEAQMPWRESVSTISQGGKVDSGQLDLYSAPFTDRLVFGVSGRVRRLGLPAAANSSDTMPVAMQYFGAAGADLVLWVDPDHTTPGEIYDDDLLFSAPLASAAVVSYRHYELTSNNPFGQRLVLVERSQIEEVSGVYRKVLGKRGGLGLELRGGAGYDYARQVRQWRAGASVLVSATANSRLTLAYDANSEVGTGLGLAGQRHTGWVILHVDL